MLNRKKARELIKPTATQLNIDLILADDIIQFYWEKVREALEEPKHCNIFVSGLGIFKASNKKLMKFNNYVYDRILKYKENDIRSENRKKKDELTMKFLNKLQTLILEEENHKNLVNLKKGKL